MSDPKDLERAIRRFRWYWWIANSHLVFIAVILVLLVARWLLPFVNEAVFEILWLPFALAMFLVAIPWILIGFGFQLGRIECPMCARRFGGRLGWVGSSCASCGFNPACLLRLRRPGDHG